MGIFDKFTGSFNQYDDDYDDEYLDDYSDEELDDYAEKKPSKVRMFSKKSKKNTSYEDEYYDEPINKTPEDFSDSESTAEVGVCVVRPNTVDDGREICDILKEGKTVILNVEGVDLEIAQRIIDFTSGSTYAIKGNLQKISNAIFVITPVDVKIAGDLQDILGGSFEASSIRNRY